MVDAGKEVPGFESRPDIREYMWLWEAFIKHLSTCRPPGFGGISRIPWTATQMYAETYRLTGHETYMLHEVTMHLDMLWVGHANKKRR